MICAEMIRATNRLDELCPISANTKRPLVAESGPSILWNLGHLNVRFGEKRTLFLGRPKSAHGTSGFHVRSQAVDATPALILSAAVSIPPYGINW